MKKRIMSFIFCFLLLFGMCFTVWADSTAETSFAVTYEGEEIEEIIFAQDEKRIVEVLTDGGGNSCDYQWQILISMEEQAWADIYEQTKTTLEVSYALIEEVMDEAGSAYIRCKAITDTEEIYTDVVCVTITPAPVVQDYDVQLAPVLETAQRFAVGPMRGASVEKVTIKVNYLDAEKGDAIYNPYIAELESGTDFSSTKIVSPTFLGYAPYWNKEDPDVAIPAEGEVDAPDDASELILEYSNVTSNIVVNVYYKPIEVSYSVKYFFQDVNSDLYTENETFFRIGYAKTGTIMTDAELALDANDTIGFTKLYHYPESVAADGSTAFECYYDRNYYLLKFDMDGGYGVDPVYGRYDAAFVVNTPIKPGYNFAGWDLVSETIDGVTYDHEDNPEKYGDGTPDVLPTHIPNKSQSYKAIWEEILTTYTVVYWTQNPNDDEYSYVGSEVREAYSNSLAEGFCTEEHEHTSSCCPDKIPVCGEISYTHTHTDSCYSCGLEEHTHVLGCYTNRNLSSTSAPFDVDDLKEGWVYKYATSGWFGTTYTNYLYVNGTWYRLGTDGTYAGVGLSGTLNNPRVGSVNGVEAIPTCGKTAHTHTEECCSCGYHVHTDECYFDLRFYEYETTILTDENGDPIKVMGDGSTVVNVRFKRKVYTFQFYISRYKTTTGQYQVGGYTTDFANVSTDDLADMLGEVTWGTVNEQPTLNDAGTAAGYKILETEEIDGCIYQYIEMTARYGQYIKDLFPVAMLDPIVAEETCVANVAAYFSAWNVEHCTNYSWHHSNKTLKGRYLNLDYTMLANCCQMYGYVDENCDSHDQFLDRDTIRFVAFWENVTNQTWNIPHMFNYNIYLPVLDGEEADKTYKEVDYRLEDTCVVYDNNDSSGSGWLTEHTEPAVEGFTFLESYGERTRSWGPNSVLGEHEVDFYYTRNNYNLQFMNYDRIDKTESAIPFESSMAEYYYVPDYPENLEENAYTFDGWYTSEKCVDGTKYDFASSTMPASDLILYAKWTPVVHTVRFFQTYNDMLDYEKDGSVEPIYKVTRNHGQVVGTVEEPNDQSGHNYSFGGWFYMNTGVKTAFTPLDMPVKSDINIFADWGSHTAQPFMVHYILENKETSTEIIELLQTEAEGTPKDNVRYTIEYNEKTYGYVYLNEDSGWHLCVADSTNGYAYQGSTRTFVAKAGDPYNQLYATGDTNYNNGYYPLTASHSITMEYEENVLIPQTNVFSFKYVSAHNLEYTVHYLDKNTGDVLEPSVTKPSEGKAVITERFAVIADYVPDAFYKRLVIAVEKNSNGEYVSSSENVITFYYTPNDTVAYYAIHYMLQKSGTDGGDGTNKAIDGTGHYEESDFHTEGVGDIGGMQRITPLNFTGFQHLNEDGAKTLIDGTEKTIDIVDAENDYCDIEIHASGTELYIFYERLSYDYTIYHLRYGTDVSKVLDGSNTEGLLKKETVDSESNPLTAQYGTVVSATTELKPSDDVFKRLVCVSNLTQSITIKADSTQNNIIFFYAPVQYTVEYKVAGDIGGSVSKTIEVVDDDEAEFEGSIATADPGYEFVGWYEDEECTIPATDENGDESNYAPEIDTLDPMPAKNIFYAKFSPLYGDLTITRTEAANEGNGTQVFVYKITNVSNPSEVFYVTIQGSGSVTIHNLLQTTYTVEQQEGWSWRHDGENTTKSVTVPAGNTTITFDDTATNQWLNANSNHLKNTKGGTP